MTTSKKDASMAGKILSNPKSSKAARSVAASDLAQAKPPQRSAPGKPAAPKKK